MVAVIGDVHGCFYTLQNLVEKIRSKYPQINIYCVGDLVDRGNYSLQVIDFITAENILFTLGNHDLMFYSYYNDPDSLMAKNWNHNGSSFTISSYDGKPQKLKEHLSYIIKAPLFIDTPDCFISHAGISASYKNVIAKNDFDNLSELNKILLQDIQESYSIIWARGELMNIGKLQVVGHTHRKENFFNKDSNTLYIDTTAFGMNKLTAAIVDQNNVVEILDQKTFRDDTDSRWNYYL
jgi:serine/threonine protein phosphatase 1